MDAQGFVRFRHWRLYGERGLIGADAAVWLFGDTLTIEYATETLAQYQVATVPTSRHIRDITEPHLFATQHRSPPPFLDTVAWHPVLRLVPYQPRRKVEGGSDRQLPLFEVVREACGTWTVRSATDTANIRPPMSWPGATAHYGKGYGTEATQFMLDYGFTALVLQNIMLRVFAYNAAGVRGYEKAGIRASSGSTVDGRSGLGSRLRSMTLAQAEIA